MKSSIKKQPINTIRVFTQENQVYTNKGRNNKRFQIPLRWIPVTRAE